MSGAGAATYKYLDQLFKRLVEPKTADIAMKYLQEMQPGNFVNVGAIEEENFAQLLQKLETTQISDKQRLHPLRMMLINARINGLRAAHPDSGALQELYQTEFDFIGDLLVISRDLERIPETKEIEGLKTAIAEYLKNSFAVQSELLDLAVQPELLDLEELGAAFDEDLSDEYLSSLKLRIGVGIVSDLRGWIAAQKAYLSTDTEKYRLKQSAEAIKAMYDVGALMTSYPALQGNLIKIVQRSTKYGLLFTEMRKSIQPLVVFPLLLNDLEKSAQTLNANIGRAGEMESMVRARKNSFASTAANSTAKNNVNSQRPLHRRVASKLVETGTKLTETASYKLHRRPPAAVTTSPLVPGNRERDNLEKMLKKRVPSPAPAAPAPVVATPPRPPIPSRPQIKVEKYNYQGFDLEIRTDPSKKSDHPDKETWWYKKPDGENERVYCDADGDLVFIDPAGKQRKLSEKFTPKHPSAT